MQDRLTTNNSNESSSSKEEWDYIITGAGCAGLSLAMHMMQSGRLSDKRILIIDKEPKDKNDRTWCFWEKAEGLFQPIVAKEWEQLRFTSSLVSKQLEIAPYKYKLIRGIDFYNCCKEQLSKHPNIQWLTQAVGKVESRNSKAVVHAGGQTFEAQFVFNSILFTKPQLKQTEYWLLQHFKGWYITTKKHHFNAASATLMDFNCSQQNGTTFFYVLPLSQTEALVEYTLFSKELLAGHLYDEALKAYIKEVLKIDEYEVAEQEFGIIPMTNFHFPSASGNVLNIGTSGGQTKASSGYTFRFIQKQSASIVQSLIQTGMPFNVPETSSRFRFYDSVLLAILNNNTLPGDVIFSKLFQKNNAKNVFKFLDNETSLFEELKIISSLPTMPFARTAVKQVF
jgi:lycopene beta-cyclase